MAVVTAGPGGGASGRAKRRLFVAVTPSAHARDLLAAQLDEVTGRAPLPGRVVPPENWHVTLRFLGWSDEVARERITAGLDQARLGEGFWVTLRGLGAFPRPRRATVLWVGVTHGAERLGELAATVEEAAQRAGYDPEDRPFVPHVTLSRIRPHQDVSALVEGARVGPIRFHVGEVVLYESKLGRGGARYEALERFDLV